MNEMSWADVSSPEGLKKTILAIVALIVFIVGDVSTSIAADVGNYIIQALNKTGFTIPSSANYVAPIASLPSFLPLILMIVFIVVGVVTIIQILSKVFSNLGT
jgi:hypothetical protein